MSLVRPEIRSALEKWRDVVVGLCAALVGGYWTMTAFGALWIIGMAMALGGIALAFAGLQRVRFAQSGEGPGIVSVREGQITFMGPYGGGIAALSDLIRVSFDPGQMGHAHWLLETHGEEPLAIPVDAKGAETLFGSFASLPGMRTERLLQYLNDPPEETVVIWQRGNQTPRVDSIGLH